MIVFLIADTGAASRSQYWTFMPLMTTSARGRVDESIYDRSNNDGRTFLLATSVIYNTKVDISRLTTSHLLRSRVSHYVIEEWSYKQRGHCWIFCANTIFQHILTV